VAAQGKAAPKRDLQARRAGFLRRIQPKCGVSPRFGPDEGKCSVLAPILGSISGNCFSFEQNDGNCALPTLACPLARCYDGEVARGGPRTVHPRETGSNAQE
jgi:hypothetical protein